MSGNLRTSHNEYPLLLKELRDCPDILYYKGQLDSALFTKCLAVVGSRKITPYGISLIHEFVSKIALHGVTIVSGFMYGADALAHEACVRNNGRTIAVMGCGIDLVYPSYQIDLYNEILQNNGLIMSEYEGDSAPQSWTFARRNRIIAGLSHAILVVEAAEGSGALITAEVGQKLGRPILVPPRNIGSKNSFGIFELIRQSSLVVTQVDDVLRILDIEPQIQNHTSVDSLNLRPLEKSVYKLIRQNGATIDDIYNEVSQNAGLVGQAITSLLMLDLIFEQGGVFYVGKS